VAARGTTFAKQDRERAKKAKAAQKQERRAAREAEQAEQAPAEIPAEGEIPPETLLRLVQELHDNFAEGRISFEEFEEAKTELMARISVT
jgi:hypothetical protein